MSASLSHWRESVLSGLAGEGRLRLVGRGLLLLLCLAAPAGAATVHEGSIMMDLEWAHSVVTATIGPSRVEVDHRGLPQTVYELTDVEGIKGAPPYPSRSGSTVVSPTPC